MSTDPFAQSPEYIAMLPARNMISALLGGTEAMRIAARAYLPQEMGETAEDYDKRLSRSFLLNQFERTVNAATGKVLSDPVAFPDLPPDMVSWNEDIDLEGTDVQQFFRRWFRDGTAFGVSYVLVDTPRPSLPTGLRTIADDAAEGIRPYMVHVPAMNLVGWRHEKINGRWRLTQARIREDVYVPNGEYGEVRVERVRVLTPGRYAVWQRSLDPINRPVNFLLEEGETGLDFIPLVPFYTGRLGRFLARPPLLNLAELNVAHWQSMSDQFHILKIARIPILHVKKADDGTDDKSEVVVGGNMALQTGIDEDVEFVEHSGAAINAGRQNLLDLQEAMEKVGMSLTLRQTTGDVTATENTLTAAEAHASLTAMMDNFRDSAELAMKMMAIIGDVRVNGVIAEPTVAISKGFTNAANAADVPNLLNLYKDGAITKATLLAEIKRRGVFSEDLDIDAEVNATEGTTPVPAPAPEITVAN